MNILATTLVLWVTYGVAAAAGSDAPGCLTKCWENSKYVTACNNEMQCLCEDTEFQSIVLQCLYSQCHTAQFGSALHYALSECSGYPVTTLNDLPPLIRHQGLRKRVIEDQPLASVKPLVSAHQAFASAHQAVASVQAVRSVQRRFVSASAVANFVRPTRSAYVSAARTSTRALSTKSALPSNFDDVGYNESLAPTGVITSKVLPSRTALASVISGFGVGATEPHVRLGKADVSPSSAQYSPIDSSMNSTKSPMSLTNVAPTPTATPPIFSTAGSHYSVMLDASTSALYSPGTAPTGVGFNATTPYKKIRRGR